MSVWRQSNISSTLNWRWTDVRLTSANVDCLLNKTSCSGTLNCDHLVYHGVTRKNGAFIQQITVQKLMDHQNLMRRWWGRISNLISEANIGFYDQRCSVSWAIFHWGYKKQVSVFLLATWMFSITHMERHNAVHKYYVFARNMPFILQFKVKLR